MKYIILYKYIGRQSKQVDSGQRSKQADLGQDQDESVWTESKMSLLESKVEMA